MLGWAVNIDHYCGACSKQLTHKHHDGQTVVVDAARAKLAEGGQGQGPQMGGSEGVVHTQ